MTAVGTQETEEGPEDHSNNLFAGKVRPAHPMSPGVAAATPECLCLPLRVPNWLAERKPRAHPLDPPGLKGTGFGS